MKFTRLKEIPERPRYIHHGKSIHDVKVGNVYRLSKREKMRNPALNVKAEHILYLWLQNDGMKRLKNKQPKFRKMRVCFLFVPQVVGKEADVIIRERKIQAKYFTELLSPGYEIVGNFKYNHTDYAYKRLYQIVGIM